MKFPLPLLGAALLLPCISNAENIDQLPEVVITGTRVPTEINRITSAATVINREQIERLQARTVLEVLRGVSGLDWVDYGGFGKPTSVFIRGTNSSHVLVLIDGIRANISTNGTPTFENYPVELIERIEVVRGPQAGIYGSEAIGGVIQIFTRKGKGPRQFNATAGGGSYDSYRVSGSVSGEVDQFNYSLTVGEFSTEGINSQKSTPGLFGINEPDRDGYNNISIGARVGYQFGEEGEIEAFLMRAFGHNEFDSSFGSNQNDFLQQVAGGNLKINPLDFWQTSLRVGQFQDGADQFLPNDKFDSQFNSRRWDITWQNNFMLTDNQVLIAGVDYRNEAIDVIVDVTQPNITFAETERDNVGLFGQYNGDWQGLHWDGSIRWDHSSVTGNYLTGGLGANYRFDNGIRLLAQFGRAFKNPSFNELYYPGFSNPNLQPESSFSYEAGIEGEHGIGHWGLRFYRNEIDNLVAYVGPRFLPININTAQIDGLEAEAGIRIAGWDALLSLNWLDPEDVNTGKMLPRRTDKSLNFDVSKQFGPFNAGIKVIAQDDRFDDVANNVNIPGFVTVDLRGEYALANGFYLRATLKNLFDKDYETIKNYNQPERNFFISLHYQFK